MTSTSDVDPYQSNCLLGENVKLGQGYYTKVCFDRNVLRRKLDKTKRGIATILIKFFFYIIIYNALGVHF